MKIDILNYLFLGYVAYLPLSALKIIYSNSDHPFHRIKDLSLEKIQAELTSLNKYKHTTIKKIENRTLRILQFQKDDWNDLKNRISLWKDKGITIISYFDQKYPVLLKDISNPPKAIFTIGNVEYDRAISIIGTRNPTEYGIEMAKATGKRFAELGFTIINGFAKGIDTIALNGALGVNGHVIGILGSGLLKPYPKENLELFHSIIYDCNGGFISEFLPDEPVKKYYLASRNRISSALSLGSVFVEASKKSGTKWQLKYAKQQKKAIIAINPTGNYPQAELPNQIIKSEPYFHVINKIKDIDEIAKNIIHIRETHQKKSEQKSVLDF